MKLKYLVFAASLCVACGALADDVNVSNAVNELPLNDSIVNWDDEGMVIMDDGKAFANMYHNESGVLFQVIVKDRRLQQQALRRGLVVNIDANGKKKTKYAVHFPTLAPPKRGERPNFGEGGGRRGMGRRDTTGMFGKIEQDGGRNRERQKRSREEREKMLKMLVGQLKGQPASFFKGDDETLMATDSAKVMTSGGNVVFVACVPYDKLGKMGKKGLISLGVTLKEIEDGDGMPRMGMMPPPGMMGGMMPPPGMGRGFGGGNSLNEVKTFSEWIVFSTKNTNFTEEK